MSVNSITFRRTASEDTAHVTFDGKKTIIDLSKYKAQEREKVVHTLAVWKLSGAKGYPNV